MSLLVRRSKKAYNLDSRCPREVPFFSQATVAISLPNVCSKTKHKYQGVINYSFANVIDTIYVFYIYSLNKLSNPKLSIGLVNFQFQTVALSDITIFRLYVNDYLLEERPSDRSRLRFP